MQGVGFRPFILRLARRSRIAGYIRNTGDAGVEAILEGTEQDITTFIEALEHGAPPICAIRNIQVQKLPYSRGAFDSFRIYESTRDRRSTESTLPPDIGICEQCSTDIIGGSGSRWQGYPFTCCASCGPRFTAVSALPYDRERTNMKSFPLCHNCMREYSDIGDRRLHAQGICCQSCGPSVYLCDKGGQRIEGVAPLQEAARLIDEGALVAIKGIGGVHLSCRTTCDVPLRRLRESKRRSWQPFAVMVSSVLKVREFAEASSIEEQWLTSWRRPVVILRKHKEYSLSDLVAPGLDTIGVMLPYTGIHLLLTQYSREYALVMTSGNVSGLPMAVTNEDAVRHLGRLVDYFVLHDREIIARCDDSVMRVFGQQPTFIRRSRGWVPEPIEIPWASNSPVIGVGAELRVVGALASGKRCYLTQHIGDTDNLETIDFLRDAVEHIAGLADVKLDEAIVSRDLNPQYLSSRFADEFAERMGRSTVRVQHHHAHVASLMAEQKIPRDESVVGVVVDGAGYGNSGDIWGGEVLVCSYDSFERVGHLASHPMPGGDLCTRYPLRMCAAMLRQYLDEPHIRKLILSKTGEGSLAESDLARLEVQLESGFNLPWTSSAGRALDAFSAITGTCVVRTYEGEPAMRLEALAPRWSEATNTPRPEVSGNVVDTSGFLYELLTSWNEMSVVEASYCYQRGLVRALTQIAVDEAKRRGIDAVAITGGAAVNTIIIRAAEELVLENDLKFLRHQLVPCGDGGLALGQVCVANTTV